jgi:hypothetical protein
MHYFLPLIIITLLFSPLNANDFESLNLPLTKNMIDNQATAQICNAPAVAKRKLQKNFNYGCFCGKDYPKIKHPSKKIYQKLNLTQREELIAQYYTVKPYDTIDNACMQHDICYISKGTDAQTCNDALYKNLKDIKRAFKRKAKGKRSTSQEKRCKNLSSDMSAVLKTIFTAGTDTSLPRIGALTFNTPLIIGSKIFTRTPYPRKDEPCLLK